MIRLSEKTGIPIAVSVGVNGVSIYKRAKEENRNIPKPILIESLWDLEHCGEVLIDDLDIMLEQLTNGRIKAITMTQDMAHDEEWFRMPKKEENEERRVSSYDVVPLKKCGNVDDISAE